MSLILLLMKLAKEFSVKFDIISRISGEFESPRKVRFAYANFIDSTSRWKVSGLGARLLKFERMLRMKLMMTEVLGSGAEWRVKSVRKFVEIGALHWGLELKIFSFKLSDRAFDRRNFLPKEVFGRRNFWPKELLVERTFGRKSFWSKELLVGRTFGRKSF